MKNKLHYRQSTTLSNPWGLKILNGGKQSIPINGHYPPENHPKRYNFNWELGRTLNEYQILLVTEGHGIFEYDKNNPPHTIQAPFIFLIFPETWHRYRPNPKYKWTEYWIGFNGQIPDALYKEGQISSKTPFIAQPNCASLIPQFQKALHLFEQSSDLNEQQLNIILFQILNEICNQPTPLSNISDKNQQAIEKACAYINENIHIAINWEGLSKDLGISYSLFRKLFKEIENVSPKKYQRIARLEKAQFLLSHTSMSINQIASELGYTDQFHFSTQFKQSLGKSPKNWKNASQSN